MSVGRIKYNKLLEKIKIRKYNKYNIPIKNKSNKWSLKTKDLIAQKEIIYQNNILEVMSEYCKDSLGYYFNYGKRIGNKEEHISHDHSFDKVLEYLYRFPETFNIPKDCEEFYSKRELSFLNNLQNKLLEDNLKDIGIFYKEHPLKKEYEEYYLVYNYEELRKRKIKKVHGISIKKHEILHKKSSN